MFLHYILNEDQESIICRFYKAQVKNPTINDWSVENDLKELGISQSNAEIETLKKDKFAEIVKQAVEERALQFLSSVKLKHAKVLQFVHIKLCMQEYLKPNKVQNINLSKFIFHARTRMLDCKTNFSNGHKNEEINCPLKCQEQDTQKHLLECRKIDPHCTVPCKDVPDYDDLFGVNVDKQMKIASILQERLCKRKKILSKGAN